MKKVAYVGVDYHMNSLSIAVMVEGEKKIHEMIRLANDDGVISSISRSCPVSWKSELVMKLRVTVMRFSGR